MTPREYSFREAGRDDVPAVVSLLAADPLGAMREENTVPLPAACYDAFAAIEADPNQSLPVAVSVGRVVGVLQLSFIPSLAYRGSWRARIEGVRIEESMRSRGLGRALIEHAIECAKSRGCRGVQLTTDKRRPRAIAFYESLGFLPSHEGMKLQLSGD